MVIGIIVGLVVILAIWYYIRLVQATKGETPVHNPLRTQPTAPAVVRSRFLQDDIYVGKTVKLDPSLRVMFPNVLFGFPTGNLIVKDFRYFQINGNDFEEIVFEKQDDKDYIILYDSLEHDIYFLNRVMSQSLQPGEVPVMGTNESIDLEENGNHYVYTDISGLLEVTVSGKNISTYDRVIRMYEREVTPDDNEYLICMCNASAKQGTNMVVDFYIGFMIQKQQLEDI